MVARLCLTSEGLLYEDADVQVGLKSRYQRHQGQVALYFGNKTAGPLTNFQAVLTPVSYLSVEMAPIASEVQAGTQAQVALRITCTESYQGTGPTMRVAYLSGGLQRTLTLQLPVPMNKFCEGITLGAEDFFSRWRSIAAGAPLEAQAIFQASERTLDLAYARQLLGEGMQLAVLDGVDQNPLNLVGAGVFYSTQHPVGVLVRLESNRDAGMYRLTVRSQQPLITTAVAETVQAALAAE